MNEGLPRSLLALTVIVAGSVIFLVIKDSVQPRNAKAPASTITPTGIDSKTGAMQKKTTSLKARRARISATEADDPATAQAAADETEKPLVRQESGNSGAKEGVANNKAPNAVPAAHDDQEIAMGRINNGVRNELDTIKASEILRPALSAPQCVPLPNVTSPADVDAPYYRNWAREYSCFDLMQSVAAASN